jgi:integrase
MARPPKLRKKNGYWMTKAGGTETYFGKVRVLPHADAKQLFLNHLKSVSESKPARSAAVTAEMLSDFHLEWIQANRSEDLFKQRQHFLSRWCDFVVGQGRERVMVGELAAAAVTAEHLLAWKESLYADGHHDTTVQHALAAVKSCWYWGVRFKHLPEACKPFTIVEKIRIAAKAVHEQDLMTANERDALIRSADADFGKIRDGKSGKYRSRKPAEYRLGEENPYRGFADMLRLYYHTGARTSELSDAKVRDFEPRVRKLVLTKHKRTRTMKVAVPRVITLNAKALAILKRQCAGKDPDDALFTQGNGRPWDKNLLDARFRKIRKLARVREKVTIYDFRHLWISEALMAGVDVFTVAKMAGTSVQMIEKTYGHLRGAHLEDAQRSLDLARQKTG